MERLGRNSWASSIVRVRTQRNRPEIRDDALSSIWIVADRYPHLDASELADRAIWEAYALHRNADSVVDPDTLDHMPDVVQGHDTDDDHAERRAIRADQLIGIALERLGISVCVALSDGLTASQAAERAGVSRDTVFRGMRDVRTAAHRREICND